MFYSHTLLSRKGPLGIIWIAAYCFRNLRKQQIEGTNIPSSVDKIMLELQISHRVLAQLLLGIVKIFSKQVDYLCDECDEALTKLRKSFTPSRGPTYQKPRARTGKDSAVNGEAGSVQKHRAAEVEENATFHLIETIRAAYHQVGITLPDRFELDSFDLGIPDSVDTGGTHQQSKRQDELTDDFIRPSFLKECFSTEPVVPVNSTCFTPLADILPCSLMDVDLELSEPNSSSIFASAQKTQSDIQKSECEKHDILSVSVSQDNSVRDDIPEILSNIHQLEEQRNQTKLMPSEKDKSVQLENQRNDTKLMPLDCDKIIADEERRNQNESSDLKRLHLSQNDEVNVIEEPHSDALLPNKSQRKSDLSGTPSPTFKMTTPTIKERPPTSKKRKRSFNGSIILSNGFMRQMLHDASDLVFKRRKAPHTDLDVWRSHTLLNIEQSFIQSLITVSSLEMKTLLQKKLPVNPPDSPKTHVDAEMSELPKKKKLSEDLKEPAQSLIDPTNGKNEMPYRSSDILITESEVLIQQKQTTSSEMLGKEITSSDTSEFQVVFMDTGSHENAIDQDHEWSARTREVARYLYNKFRALKAKNQEGILRLFENFEGKPRAKCARLFYETLALKTHSCIDVIQDCPYGDISMSPTSKLESFL
ncbi:Sister chromatid cohesion 1 protein 2 [Apostasia shenzhenica]|uniref:Sister chromatid cohesion 1 protein 2 n=1 Tax=Apostasia shenzhenica TaxID=1088818 RepID=A0A2I0BE85_9ASPA|nr:Sister chromatid cohesion 1 protein 2 [Apostasia shenzhenica]